MLLGPVICILFTVTNAMLCPGKQGAYDWDNPSGICQFTGYVPGGNRVILQPISSPNADNQGRAIAQAANGCGYRTQVIGAVLDFGQYSKKFKAAAKVMSSCLGVWGSVVGGFLFKQPTTANVLDAMNSAFDKLTQEVNEQFYNMEEYVKQSILDLQKELMSDKYKKYQFLLNLCLDRFELNSIIDCLRNAHDESLADQGSFMRYKVQMQNSSWGSWHNGGAKKREEVQIENQPNRQSCFFACADRLKDNYNGVVYGQVGGPRERECYCQKEMTGFDAADGLDLIWQAALICGTGSFRRGDAVALEQEQLPGHYDSKQSCFRACFEKKLSNSSYNGATYGIIGGPREKDCWCNKGMSSWKVNLEWWESAFLANFPPVHWNGDFRPGLSHYKGHPPTEHFIGNYNTKQDCWRACSGFVSRGEKHWQGVTFGRLGGDRSGECWCEYEMDAHGDYVNKWESAFLSYDGGVQCQCIGGTETGAHCDEWDDDGTWCYVNSPNDCDDATPKDGSSYYASKRACASEVNETYYEPEVDDVKHMEVQFLTFRNYAQLRVLILISLIGTFENVTDVEYANAPDYYKIYLGRLQEELDLYIRYAEFIFNQIVHMRATTYEWFYTTVVSGTSKDVIRSRMDEWGGMECSGRFSQMLIETDLCKQTYWLNRQGCKDYKEIWDMVPPSESIGPVSFPDSFREYAKHRMGVDAFSKYNEAETKTIVLYWTSQIMRHLPIWKEILTGALAKLEEVKDIDLMNQGNKERTEL